MSTSHQLTELDELRHLWRTAVETIRPRINPANFDRWFRPLKCVSAENEYLIIEAPNRYIKEWFEDNFLAIMTETVRRCSKRSYKIRIQAAESGSDRGFADTPETPDRVPPASSPPGAPNLNEKYTFDTYVVGPSNQLAQAASRAVSEMPARKYNPLFIYGGVGLGKTHLLCAIGHEVLRRQPSWKVVYVTTERFMIDYINHIRTNRIDQFRHVYRQQCDVLLIDDIQFIAGKDRTQEEFFHTFNVLYEAGRQIVVTSDQFPHEIPGLEDRLRNRFQWGLIADIQSPELETRVAILKRKAELEEITLPDDVALYLASHIQSNVRELEGALVRLTAFSNLYGKEITIEFAQKTLKNLIERPYSKLSVESIQREAAGYFNVKVSDLKGNRRHRTVAYPRQIAMFLTRTLTEHSYPEIGEKFGGKDHTTVLAAVRKIERLMETDMTTRSDVEYLKKRITKQ